MAPETPKLLTPEQVAEQMAVSPKTVRDWLRAGKLPGYKLVGKVWRIAESDLQEFMEKWKHSPAETPPDSGADITTKTEE